MLKKLLKKQDSWNISEFYVKWYPSVKSCVKHNTNNVRPQHMPPLMVRKAAWRR